MKLEHQACDAHAAAPPSPQTDPGGRRCCTAAGQPGRLLGRPFSGLFLTRQEPPRRKTWRYLAKAPVSHIRAVRRVKPENGRKLLRRQGMG